MAKKSGKKKTDTKTETKNKDVETHQPRRFTAEEAKNKTLRPGDVVVDEVKQL